MAIGIGQRSSSLGSGKVEYHSGQPIVHFGSPVGRVAKKRVLEKPGDEADEQVHPFVD